jgi:hypothetical protein
VARAARGSPELRSTALWRPAGRGLTNGGGAGSPVEVTVKLFLSYSRKDEGRVTPLAEGLEHLGHEVWFDQDLAGGAEWWLAILEQIARSDVFVAVVSPAALDSTACARERDYALALQRPLLPVVLEQVDVRILPEAIAQRQLVHFSAGDIGEAFRLAGALARLPVAPPLPDPLPTPPDAPLSYLSGISQRIGQATALTEHDQLDIAVHLREAILRGEDRDAARHLARALMRRGDLLVRAERLLRDLVETTQGDPMPGQESAGTRRRDASVGGARPVPGSFRRPGDVGAARRPVIIADLVRPEAAVVADGTCYALRQRGGTGGVELVAHRLEDGACLASVPAPGAAGVGVCAGGVVVAGPDGIATFGLALEPGYQWSPEGGPMGLVVELTDRFVWWLVLSGGKKINPRLSVGIQYDSVLFRMELASGHVDTIPLGSDTFWTNPPHFRGAQLMALNSNGGDDIIALRGEWSAPGVYVRKEKKADFLRGPERTVRTEHAGTYSGSDYGSPDLRQVVRHQGRLLLGYAAVPGVKSRAAVSAGDLSGAHTVYESGHVLYWLTSPAGAVLLELTGKIINVFRLTRDGDRVEKCATTTGDCQGFTEVHEGVLQQLQIPSAVRGDELWWSVSGPDGFVCLDGHNRLTRLPGAGTAVIRGIWDQAYVIRPGADGQWELIVQELP